MVKKKKITEFEKRV